MLDALGSFRAYSVNVITSQLEKEEVPMTATVQSQNLSTRNIFGFYLHTNDPSTQSNRFSPTDIGYEMSEEELAKELSAQNPGIRFDQMAPEVDSQDFEAIYQWFLA